MKRKPFISVCYNYHNNKVLTKLCSYRHGVLYVFSRSVKFQIVIWPQKCLQKVKKVNYTSLSPLRHHPSEVQHYPRQPPALRPWIPTILNWTNWLPSCLLQPQNGLQGKYIILNHFHTQERLRNHRCSSICDQILITLVLMTSKPFSACSLCMSSGVR